MLQKFISIKNVGRFVNCSASGDVDFRRLTLVFAGNGQGKTTLCSVIRSLQSGDKSYLLERKTRGQPDDPAATIRVDAVNATFGARGWSATTPDIAIYDSEFIHENIYAGEFVDHEHKRRLYRIMVGQEGVALARKVDDLDEQSREVAGELRNKKSTVQAFVPKSMKLDEFLALKSQEGIDEAIAAKTADVGALRQASEIKSKSILHRVQLPELPANFASCLAEELGEIAADVEQQVQDHIDNHTNSANTTWLAQGIDFLKEDECPFCGQDTSGLDIIQAYTTIFGLEYSGLKDEIAKLQRSVDATLGEAAQLKADKTQANHVLCDFWQQFVAFEIPELDFDNDVRPALNDLFVTARELAAQKAAAPLDPIEPTDNLREFQDRYAKVKKAVDAYNAAIDVANALINKQKEITEAGNLDAESKSLESLKATKRRHEPDALDACTECLATQLKKTKIEADKAAAKDALDKFSATIFGKYKKRINALLEGFGADFRVGDLTPSYAGGHPSTSYPVVINDDQVDVGNVKTPRGTPSFRSTLSAGDRSSLALAFFIAQLETLPDLSNTIVVFDDPFTSQDRSRRTFTQQLICKKAGEARQVIVTSHDPHFLKLIWDNFSTSADIRTIQLARMGANGSTIAEWDIEEETKNSYLREITQLKGFVSHGAGDVRDIARKIRPVLEGHLRLRSPHQFQDHEWLGDFINKIRVGEASSPLHVWQGDPLDELTNINDYSKKYHHRQNPSGADTEPIDDGELRAYVRRTLKFVGSC